MGGSAHPTPMPPYEHRKAKALHKYRHGWTHFTAHRDGEAHGHRRRRSRRTRLSPQRTPSDTVRHARHLLRSRRPLELATQIAMGIGLGIAVAFVVLAIWAVVTVIQARNDLRGAQSEATALAVDRTQLFTAHGRAHAAAQIAAMQHGTTSAAALVDGSVPLHALSWIPFVGQQVTGVKQLVGDFKTTSEQAGTLLASLQQLLRFSHGTSVSLPALNVLDHQVHRAVVILRPLDRGSGVLVGPLAGARSSFDKEIAKVTALLAAGGNLLDYAGPFLGGDGPRTYFVAGENDAEMRDQGAVLSWAILSAENGTFTMAKSHSVGTLRIRHPAQVPLPMGTLAAFGAMEPRQVWQSVNASADFPLSSEVMAAMYTRRTHRHVDGVIGVDPEVLRHVLEATGGVFVSGVPAQVKANNVEYVLMHGLYLLYPRGYQQSRRHDEVAEVASAAVSRMKHHHFDLAYLVDQLAKAVRGRHLLVWSRFPKLEAAVTRFGASGSLTALGPDEVHLAVESAVAAKLDWYVHTKVAYNVSVDPNGTATILATIVVSNSAKRGCWPHYVCGPDHLNSNVRGQYVGRIDLWLPRGAVVPGGLAESGLELARWVVRLDPGRSETVVLAGVLKHAVSDGHMDLVFVPQSGVNPQQATVTFSAPGWSVAGPSQASWSSTRDQALHWLLSH